MPDTNPLFETSTAFGVALFQAHKQAVKEGEKAVPFGKQRIEPAEFRKEQAADPMLRKATLARLVKEQGGERQGHREYRRMLEGK